MSFKNRQRREGRESLLGLWFTSDSEPIPLRSLLVQIKRGARPDEFHTCGWDTSRGKGLTFREVVKSTGWAADLATLGPSIVQWAIELTNCEVDDLEATMAGEQILLTGYAASFYDLKLAQDAAMAVMGPELVVNEIVVGNPHAQQQHPCHHLNR